MNSRILEQYEPNNEEQDEPTWELEPLPEDHADQCNGCALCEI